MRILYLLGGALLLALVSVGTYLLARQRTFIGQPASAVLEAKGPPIFVLSSYEVEDTGNGAAEVDFYGAAKDPRVTLPTSEEMKRRWLLYSGDGEFRSQADIHLAELKQRSQGFAGSTRAGPSFGGTKFQLLRVGGQGHVLESVTLKAYYIELNERDKAASAPPKPASGSAK